MKIDYGVGYDPRNRPLRIEDTSPLRIEDTSPDQVVIPVEPNTDHNTASHSHQDHEPTHTVLHYGVIMLKVCVDGNSNDQPAPAESTHNQPNIVYASSGYDPRSRG